MVSVCRSNRSGWPRGAHIWAILYHVQSELTILNDHWHWSNHKLVAVWAPHWWLKAAFLAQLWLTVHYFLVKSKEFFKLLHLFNQQSKTLRLFISYHKWQKSSMFDILLEKWPKLINYQNSWQLIFFQLYNQLIDLWLEWMITELHSQINSDLHTYWRSHWMMIDFYV